MATLYIIRGLPGSGKTTLAKKIVGENYREADQFFMVDGEYKFNPAKLKDAHNWCFAEICKMINCGVECAVSNTFTRHWEYENYMAEAVDNGYEVQVIECHGNWRNTHGVPDYAIKNMRDRWEPHKN